MDALTSINEDDCLEIIAQFPFLNIYTQICFCFPVADESSHSAIVDTLTNGLERLSEKFPWVAGQLVNEGASEGNTGTFKIKPLGKIPPLIVKDLRDDPSIPTMDALSRAKFPMSMLDEKNIAARATIPDRTGDPKPDAAFLVQATFITGGLLLTFCGQHNIMDMTGQNQVMNLLSKACRNEEFTSEEISIGNLARGNIIPLLDDPETEVSDYTTKSAPDQGNSNSKAAQNTPPKCTWASFVFDASSLAALKSIAMESLANPTGYISTDDAICAFIWKCVTRARLPRLDPRSQSKFSRAVDVRRYLDIPATYPGAVQNMANTTSVLQSLLDAPLGYVACQLRSAVDPKTSNLGFETRALATLLSRTPDKNSLSHMAATNYSRDIMLSSWAKFNCYDLDFGFGLGKPEAVQRPLFIPFECLMYLLPKKLNGDMGVVLCLEDGDLERLRADKEFTEYGAFTG
ncbi:hypothetical protein FQN49_001211 [Arthroderma sp. PD_2]|nr:hypothetical protein FQN49_001211 [Arthroderma sp. PD_2]